MMEKFVKLIIRYSISRKICAKVTKNCQIDHPGSRNFIPTKNIDHPGSRNFIPTQNMDHPGVGIKFLPWVPITKNDKNIN